jgi:glycosyltransferase involved in cell wall biosynthesis
MNMGVGKARVLWLISHTTLRAFEVPLLTTMGYEVFLPKSFPYDEGNLSASIDYGFDPTLSIPPADLEILNRQDFYTYLTPEAVRIINNYFDFAIIGFFPEQLDGLVRDFKGTIIMRPFGLANGVTYTDVIAQSLGQGFFSRLEKNSERFWFGQAYDNLADIEKGVLARRATHLPLGLANSDRPPWRGALSKILFVCPRIKTTTYFEHIYREFKRDFGDLPHMIGGAQPIVVEDPAVLGFVPRDKFDDLFCNARVMFYHSRERRHLHYHPLEAVQSGMPLVFMADGMLDHVGGKDLPGRARTVKEAREKLVRILKGDTRFIEAVRRTQGKLLDTFSRERCQEIWNKNFSSVASAASRSMKPRIKPGKRRKIAMILTEAYLGGTLEVAKLATKMLNKGSAEAGEPCDVVFYHLPSALYDDRSFIDLEQERIPVRDFSWKLLDFKTAHDALTLSDWQGPMPHGARFAVPDDGSDNLSSFDHWIFLTDRFPERVLPLRPYSVYVHDFLQRYVPSLYGPQYEHTIIDSLRGAEQVLCATDHTCSDAVQYAGVNSKKVRLVPLVTEFVDNIPRRPPHKTKMPPKYFLWLTNVEYHKNHLPVIEALSDYYFNLDGQFRCIIAGVNTNWFDPDLDEPSTPSDYVHRARNAFKASNLVNRKVEMLGYISQSRYWDLLRGAEFVFHPTLIDNGTLVTVEAASVGVPLLSNDYPPMRFYERRFNIPIKFMDARKVDDIANSLIEMESEADTLRKRMPSRELLEHFHWRNQASAFWEVVRNGVG